MYSPADIVGLILYARTKVPVKENPSDNSPITGYIEKGQAVGKVYIYLEPKPGRTRMWWMFYDKYRRPYYTEHREGYYSIKQIRDQGALTREEKVELEEEENKTPVEKITDTAKSVTKMAVRGFMIYGGMRIVLALLKK